MNNSIALKYDDEFYARYPQARELEELHIKYDVKNRLTAIIAISDTKRGPAIGGCRCLSYPSFEAALQDAIRLARGMSYKAAINQLPCGGGKAVLLKPSAHFDPVSFFSAFGRLLNDLRGRYVTSIDSGTSPKELAIIAQETPYVTGLNTESQQGNPAPYTALGVQYAIEAALYFIYGTPALAGRHVAIQGVGQVGYLLAKNLAKAGAKITIADINPLAAKRCYKEFSANVVAPEEIYQVECDVFAPCALGDILNEYTVSQLQCPIIAGAANNQLSKPAIAEVLAQRNILYAPDYLVNSGGLIHAAYLYAKAAKSEAEQKITGIYHTLLTIFQEARQQNTHALAIANQRVMSQL